MIVLNSGLANNDAIRLGDAYRNVQVSIVGQGTVYLLCSSLSLDSRGGRIAANISTNNYRRRLASAFGLAEIDSLVSETSLQPVIGRGSFADYVKPPVGGKVSSR